MVVTRHQQRKNDRIAHLCQSMVNAYNLQQQLDTIKKCEDIIDQNPDIVITSSKVVSIADLIETHSNIDEKVQNNPGAATLLECFQDERHTHPIHWAARLGLAKVVKKLLSTNKSLVFERTGSTLMIPLYFAGQSKDQDTKHALIKAHPSFSSLEADVAEHLEIELRPMAALELCLSFRYHCILDMFIEALPDEVRNSPVNLIVEAVDFENEDALIKLIEFDPDYAKHRIEGGYLPLNFVYNSGEKWEEEGRDYLRRFLSSSRFYGIFESVYLSPEDAAIPPWRRSNTHWLDLLERTKVFPVDIFEHAKFCSVPLINDAVGKMPVPWILRMVPYFNIDTDMTDEEGRDLLTVAIHRSKEYSLNHWKEYFMFIVLYAFLRKYRFQRRDSSEKSFVHDSFARISSTAIFATTFCSNKRLRKLLIVVSGKQSSCGQYLLHILAKEGLPTSFVVDYMDGNCDDLVRPDRHSGLLPFMLAAMGSAQSNLSTSFEMLRMRPDTIDMLRQQSMINDVITNKMPTKRRRMMRDMLHES